MLFQFHKGTIRTFAIIPAAERQGNFNSIKVRLELNSLYLVFFLTRFQFHKGTIRTVNDPSISDSERHFNSIKVRLELDSPMITFEEMQNFNSIKVRLEQHLSWPVTVALISFQFHKGTIRTARLMPFELVTKYFNSIKVRLEQIERAQIVTWMEFQFHKGTIRTLLQLR